MTDLQQSIVLDPPREVDIPAIERELTQLWKQAGEDVSSTEAPVVRACSLNLIIFIEGGDRANGLEEIIGQLTLDHPSRLFVVAADRRTSTAGIEAWVSARCSLPVPGGKQVCCEEINLSVKGTDAGKVSSIISSLLVPDVPGILLWKARPDARDIVLQQLTQLVDRVVIDSSVELRPARPLASWGEFMESRSGRTAFGDLAWTNLVQWRSWLAQAFQPGDEREHLRSINAITIEYRSSDVPPRSGLSQSLLLGVWLAHALRWVVVHPLKEGNDGELVAKFRFDEQAIDVKVLRVPAKRGGAGGMESIMIHSSRGGEVELRMMDLVGCVQQRISLSGGGAEESLISVQHRTEAELVSGELDVLYRDDAYEKSMVLLKTLLTP